MQSATSDFSAAPESLNNLASNGGILDPIHKAQQKLKILISQLPKQPRTA
jgi:hypothetical protein